MSIPKKSMACAFSVPRCPAGPTVINERRQIRSAEVRLEELTRDLHPDILHAHFPVLNAIPAHPRRSPPVRNTVDIEGFQLSGEPDAAMKAQSGLSGMTVIGFS